MIVKETKTIKTKVATNKNAKSPSNTPVIGLALGGGGSLGLAHIGVLKVLEQNGIFASKIAGTSMGAIVGALYSLGYSVEEMYIAAKSIKTYQIIDINITGKGLFTGSGAEKFLGKFLPKDKNFADLKKDFCCNALNLNNGEEVVLNSGSVLKAVRASFSVPLIFKPTQLNEMLLVDGGLVNNLPDNHVKNLGADFVISVDIINKYPNKATIKSLRDVVYYSSVATQLKVQKLKKSCSDIIIKPQLGNYKQYVFSKNLIENVIKQGELAAQKAMPEILQKIKEFNCNY